MAVLRDAHRTIFRPRHLLSLFFLSLLCLTTIPAQAATAIRSSARPMSELIAPPPASAAAAIHPAVPTPTPTPAPIVSRPILGGPLTDPHGTLEGGFASGNATGQTQILYVPGYYQQPPNGNDCQFHIDPLTARLDGSAKGVVSYQPPRLSGSPYAMTEAATLADGRQIVVETSACWRVEHRFFVSGLGDLPAAGSKDFFAFLRARLADLPVRPDRLAARDLLGLIDALETAAQTPGALQPGTLSDGPYLHLRWDAHSFALIADAARLQVN